MAEDRERERLDKMMESQARIEEKINNLERTVASLQLSLLSNYVTQEAFAPVRALVYSMVGLILISVITSLLFLVVKK